MKNYVYRVYSVERVLWDEAIWDVDYWDFTNNTFVGTWAKEVISQPKFRSVINGGTSELVVRLARDFQDYGEGNDIAHYNKVDLWCYDTDAPNGTKIYSGFIAEYTPTYENGNQYLDVTILPYDAELGTKILQDTSGYTARQYLSEDPSAIMRDVIDQYRATKSGTIQYTASSVDDTGTVVSYTFNSVTIREALDKVIELAPEGWYYRVDPDGEIHFHEQNGSNAVHSLNIAKHIKSIRSSQDMSRLINTVYFVGGTPIGSPQIYQKKETNTSSALYGEWEVKQVDLRVTLDSTAETIMDNILDERSQPRIVFDIEVVDNNNTGSRGYDIESIRPGDTVEVKGLFSEDIDVTRWDTALWDSSFWDAQRNYTLTQPQVITSVDYTPTGARIQATNKLPEVSKRIEDINRNLEAMQFAEIPIRPETL